MNLAALATTSYFFNTPGSSKPFHRDALGSVIGISGPDSQWYNEYHYLSFGKTIPDKETIAQNYTYIGKDKIGDDGLYFYQSRVYDSRVGRFTSQDAMRDGLNWYRYSENDPINNFNPDGFSSCWSECESVRRWSKRVKCRNRCRGRKIRTVVTAIRVGVNFLRPSSYRDKMNWGSYLGGNRRGKHTGGDKWAFPNWGNYCGAIYGDRSYKTACYDGVDLACARHDTCHSIFGFGSLDKYNICNLMVSADANNTSYKRKNAYKYLDLMKTLYGGPDSLATKGSLLLSWYNNAGSALSRNINIDTGRVYNERPEGLPSTMNWGEIEREALNFPFDMGTVRVNTGDLVTWMMAVKLGYDWMIAGKYSFDMSDEYRKGDIIAEILSGERDFASINSVFSEISHPENSELLKPNQNWPFESSQGFFKSYDPTYLIHGENVWY